MKILALTLFISLLGANAFADNPRLPCSYKGSEQKFAAAVKEQMRADILALKEKGVPVLDASIQLQSASVPTRTEDSAYVRLKGNFRSETGTTFELSFVFWPHDGFLGTPRDLVGYYSSLRYDALDAEGNPINGHCFLVTDGKIQVKNVKTSALVAEFPALPAYQVN